MPRWTTRTTLRIRAMYRFRESWTNRPFWLMLALLTTMLQGTASTCLTELSITRKHWRISWKVYRKIKKTIWWLIALAKFTSTAMIMNRLTNMRRQPVKTTRTTGSRLLYWPASTCAGRSITRLIWSSRNWSWGTQNVQRSTISEHTPKPTKFFRKFIRMRRWRPANSWATNTMKATRKECSGAKTSDWSCSFYSGMSRWFLRKSMMRSHMTNSF